MAKQAKEKQKQGNAVTMGGAGALARYPTVGDQMKQAFQVTHSQQLQSLINLGLAYKALAAKLEEAETAEKSHNQVRSKIYNDNKIWEHIAPNVEWTVEAGGHVVPLNMNGAQEAAPAPKESKAKKTEAPAEAPAEA